MCVKLNHAILRNHSCFSAFYVHRQRNHGGSGVWSPHKKFRNKLVHWLIIFRCFQNNLMSMLEGNMVQNLPIVLLPNFQKNVPIYHSQSHATIPNYAQSRD